MKYDFFDRYGFQVVRLLGQGAFSQVFLVRKQKTGELFACKVSDRQDFAKRESELLSKADHPLFPVFFGLWTERGTAFLLMEYVCGSSLEEFLKRRRNFTDTQTARVGMELAEGLGFLHQLPDSVLFRDVKPANVMIRQDGKVKLLDLGCACELQQSVRTRAGTPGFAAPEQLAGECRPSFASDVYGLGMTLAAMSGENRGKKLARVIAACTVKQPGLRLSDMKEVMSALAPLCEDGHNKSKIQGFQCLFAPCIICVKNIWESRYKNT
ncbi:MAG: serine/threonine protein kinase [Acetatifactor sp.]|nr:serine/threonine protein kinase [Acetatifactor sp.]